MCGGLCALICGGRKTLFIFLLSILQILNVTHRGLHVVPGLVVGGERRGVVIRSVSQGPVGSAVSEGTRFPVGGQPVHLFLFFQEREFHFNFNCTTQTHLTQNTSEYTGLKDCSCISLMLYYCSPAPVTGRSNFPFSRETRLLLRDKLSLTTPRLKHMNAGSRWREKCVRETLASLVSLF